MRTIIDKPSENRKAIAAFRRKLQEVGGRPVVREWGFPNGVRDRYPTITVPSASGSLQVGIPEQDSERVPHLIRRERTAGPPSPDVEINIPIELDRSVSGAYARGSRNILLCSRGDFTAFRGKVPRAVTFQHFSKWLIEVEDGDRLAHVIPITSVDSLTIGDNLAAFVDAVIELKALHKESGGGAKATDTVSKAAGGSWREGEEFEGQKKNSKDRAPSEAYDYAHGPICNGLFRQLRTYLAESRKFDARRNTSVDAAIVAKTGSLAHTIFEVKTSIGAQLYTAIGQLFVYRSVYGTKSSDLVLVLPSRYKQSTDRSIGACEALGIKVLFGDGEKFSSRDGKSLEKHLDGSVPK